MSVYVDDLKKYPTTFRLFKNGSCHMYADTLEELHEMAVLIGMKRSWFQSNGTLPHYDLVKQRRDAAVVAGAVDTDTAHLRGFMRRLLQR